MVEKLSEVVADFVEDFESLYAFSVEDIIEESQYIRSPILE